MSDTPTPRTDAKTHQSFESVWSSWVESSFAQKLERELAEVQKDKARLDWLSVSDTWFDDPCDGEWTPESWRAAIDQAMQADQQKPPSIESALGLPEVGANVGELEIGKGSSLRLLQQHAR